MGGGGGGEMVTQERLFNPLPEGMSTEHRGTVTVLRVDRTESNGARTSPRKLYPKMASMTML